MEFHEKILWQSSMIYEFFIYHMKITLFKIIPKNYRHISFKFNNKHILKDIELKMDIKKIILFYDILHDNYYFAVIFLF